ncbi:MAG TPA: hypothetical protein VKA67_04615 [Verrucomicrobiae bacterium]|nr:hypothetical protein [Verrucomicrobiae bacterium]
MAVLIVGRNVADIRSGQRQHDHEISVIRLTLHVAGQWLAGNGQPHRRTKNYGWTNSSYASDLPGENRGSNQRRHLRSASVDTWNAGYETFTLDDPVTVTGRLAEIPPECGFEQNIVFKLSSPTGKDGTPGGGRRALPKRTKHLSLFAFWQLIRKGKNVIFRNSNSQKQPTKSNGLL